MRYIIIPLVIMLYIFWGYKSIKDSIRIYKDPYLDGTDCEDYTYGWLLLHLSIICGALMFLIIKYW